MATTITSIVQTLSLILIMVGSSNLYADGGAVLRKHITLSFTEYTYEKLKVKY